MFGNGLFVMIHPWFKYMKLLKAVRVSRIGTMILKSQMPHSAKLTANIVKLTIYQFFYLHWMACYINFVIFINGPTEYLKNDEGYYTDL